jgi:hypothetical protein
MGGSRGRGALLWAAVAVTVAVGCEGKAGGGAPDTHDGADAGDGTSDVTDARDAGEVGDAGSDAVDGTDSRDAGEVGDAGDATPDGSDGEAGPDPGTTSDTMADGDAVGDGDGHTDSDQDPGLDLDFDAALDAEVVVPPDVGPDLDADLPDAGDGGCETAADCALGDAAPCAPRDCVAGVCVASSLELGSPCALPVAVDPQCGAAACDGLGECVVEVAAGIACDSGDLCAGAGECTASGACAAGEPVVCAPEAPCQQGACDAATGACVSSPAMDGTPCDDSDPCSEDTVCEAGACGGGASICPCDVDSDCVPARDLCVGDFRCVTLPGGGRACEIDPATVTTCAEDDDPCTQVACDPTSGQCVTSNLGGQACDDGDACSLNDHCADDGTCLGQPRDCGDQNPCSTDACDPATGLCTHAPDSGTACDDGNPCTIEDSCAIGVCQGEVLPCDDANPCTSDTCDPQTGECASTPLDGGACDGGSPCFDNSVCVAGLCAGDAPDCDDGDPCTTDSCSATVGCEHQVWTGECDDGDPCTAADTCVGGTCAGAGLDCSDDVACTEDSCEFGECVHSPDAASCDDGNPCTDEICDALAGCANPAKTAPCSDGNPCTAGDTCGGGVCLPGAADCNDDVSCTIDSCGVDGVCVHAPADSPCDDVNPCTSDHCHPVLGCVNTPQDGVSCQDGNVCTSGDLCAGGGCQPGENFCECQAHADCGSGDLCAAQFECVALPDLTRVCVQIAPPVVCAPATEPCQVVSCNAQTGACEAPAVDDLTPCPDNDPCTSDELCRGGECTATATDCDDAIACTLDACAPDSGCTHEAVDAACADDVACTSEVCDPSEGCRTTPHDGLCDDGVECTADSCTLDGCAFEPRDSQCEDGAACSVDHCDPLAGCISNADDGACDDGNICTKPSCVISEGCDYAPVDVACEDGDLCTAGDSCIDGVCSPGIVADCDDGNPCTSDVCDSATGACATTPLTGVSCDDGDPCTPTSACEDGACVGVGAPCDDGLACTLDVCNGDACTHTPTDAECDDGNACTVGTCSAGVGCVQVARPDFLTCDDATAATAPDLCVAGLCVGTQVAPIPLSGTATCSVTSEGTIKAARFGGAFYVLSRYLLVGPDCVGDGGIWSVLHRLQGTAPASTLVGSPIPGALTGVSRDLSVGIDGEIGRIDAGSGSVDFGGNDVLDALEAVLPVGSHGGVWSAELADGDTTDAYFIAGRDGAGIRVVRCDREDEAGAVGVSCGALGQVLDPSVAAALYPTAIGGRVDAGSVAAVGILARGYNGGATVMLSDGDSDFEVEHLPIFSDMHDIAFVGSEPWIVGDNGTIRRRTPTGWVAVAGPASSIVVAAFGIAVNSTRVFIFGRSPGPTGKVQATLWILPRDADPDAPASWTEIPIADNHEAYSVFATDQAVVMVGRTLEPIPESRTVAWQLDL